MKDQIADRPAPRFAVGDWAYNPLMRHNAQVQGVQWDNSLHGAGGWRYWIPGYGDPNLQPAREGARYVEYVEVREGVWQEVK